MRDRLKIKLGLVLLMKRQENYLYEKMVRWRYGYKTLKLKAKQFTSWGAALTAGHFVQGARWKQWLTLSACFLGLATPAISPLLPPPPSRWPRRRRVNTWQKMCDIRTIQYGQWWDFIVVLVYLCCCLLHFYIAFTGSQVLCKRWKRYFCMTAAVLHSRGRHQLYVLYSITVFSSLWRYWKTLEQIINQ